jgi:hypothetical protein
MTMVNGLIRVVALAALLALSACTPGGAAEPGSPATEPPATTQPPGPALDADFPLGLGESTTISGESLTVAYQTLVGDSRCKPGVKCVWEGDATVRVTVNRGNGPEAIELHTHKQFTTSAVSEGYRVTLVRLDTAGDVATLVVSKAAS